MSGENVLLLNKETVIEAIQQYLDSKMYANDRVKVIGFRFKTSNPPCYEVTLQSPEGE